MAARTHPDEQFLADGWLRWDNRREQESARGCMTPLRVSLLSLAANELVSHLYEPATRMLDDRDKRYVNQEKDMLDQRMLLQHTPSEAYVCRMCLLRHGQQCPSRGNCSLAFFSLSLAGCTT